MVENVGEPWENYRDTSGNPGQSLGILGSMTYGEDGRNMALKQAI